jgi:hypothetical protein
MKIIGLSLSFCIKDLVLGNQPTGEIVAIISGTNFNSEYWIKEAWEYYSKRYWNELNREEVVKILSTYPIIQPRNFGFPAPSIAHGHWLVIPEMDMLQKLEVNHKLYGRV